MPAHFIAEDPHGGGLSFALIVAPETSATRFPEYGVRMRICPSEPQTNPHMANDGPEPSPMHITHTIRCNVSDA